MSQCIPSPALNPPKTLDTKLSSLNRITNPSLSHLKTTPKTRNDPNICASTMSNYQQKPSLDTMSNSERRDEVMGSIKTSGLGNCLSETNLHLTVPGLKSKTRGKVRDIYDGGDYLVLVTTDRQSAFDRILTSIPFKGQFLNETSLWWFDQTQHITPNAVVLSLDKNVTIAKKCSVFPVEFVVRGYLTGSTDTSLWPVYKNGVQNYCGNVLPDGLVKSQRLPANILTPTTKAADHDMPVTPDEIVKSGLMTQDDYEEASRKALSLFEYGQEPRGRKPDSTESTQQFVQSLNNPSTDEFCKVVDSFHPNFVYLQGEQLPNDEVGSLAMDLSS